MCCCCVCQCEDAQTKDRKCCIISPLKCGIQAVGLPIIIIAVCQFLEVFYQLLNDQIDWWYVLVGCLLAIPLIVAFAFAIVFFADEGDPERVLLRTGLILTIIAITLSAAWNATYFWFFYKSNDVVTGNDGVGFIKGTRKQEIVFSVYVACVVDAILAYFICITQEYIECYREEATVKWMKEKLDWKTPEEQALVGKDDNEAGDDAASKKNAEAPAANEGEAEKNE